MPQGMRVGIYQAAARQVLFRRARGMREHASRFGLETRARRGARGKPEGAYTDICDRRLPQRNKVLRRVFKQLYARSKATPLEKRPQFVAYLRLMRKG